MPDMGYISKILCFRSAKIITSQMRYGPSVIGNISRFVKGRNSLSIGQNQYIHYRQSSVNNGLSRQHNHSVPVKCCCQYSTNTEPYSGIIIFVYIIIIIIVLVSSGIIILIYTTLNHLELLVEPLLQPHLDGKLMIVQHKLFIWQGLIKIKLLLCLHKYDNILTDFSADDPPTKLDKYDTFISQQISKDDISNISYENTQQRSRHIKAIEMEMASLRALGK